MDNSQRAIFQTLLYSDIFSFPLTQEELWTYLISQKKISHDTFLTSLQSLSDKLTQKNGYIAMQGREQIIRSRMVQEKYRVKKIMLAKRLIPLLSVVPTVMFVGISGSVAVGSAKKEDDIDIFVIVRQKTLFITRFMILILLELTQMRRKHGVASAPDKLCMNFLITDNALALKETRRDLYTAREIAQLYPLFQRADTYHKFLQSNIWITTFLPNALTQKKNHQLRSKPFSSFAARVIQVLEPFAKYIQLRFMKKKKTREEVTDSLLAFHPYDYRATILKSFSEKKEQFGL